MHIEIQVALNFVISYLYNKLPRRRVNIFGEELEKALRDKFQGHWYPEKPFKGSAFRCIKTGDPTDAVLDRAARESGVPISDILENLPNELSVWVDPGEVSYRIGEKAVVKILYSENHDNHEDNTSADREVNKTFNPEAQCFRPIDAVNTSMNSLSLSPKTSPQSGSSPHSVSSTSPTAYKGSPNTAASAITPASNGSFMQRHQAPLTFTTATFAQTKFGSTKLKTSSKRTNSSSYRMSPTEFSNYIKQRAMQQQQIHHHGPHGGGMNGAGPQSNHQFGAIGPVSPARSLSPNPMSMAMGTGNAGAQAADPFYFPNMTMGMYPPFNGHRNMFDASHFHGESNGFAPGMPLNGGHNKFNAYLDPHAFYGMPNPLQQQQTQHMSTPSPNGISPKNLDMLNKESSNNNSNLKQGNSANAITVTITSGNSTETQLSVSPLPTNISNLMANNQNESSSNIVVSSNSNTSNNSSSSNISNSSNTSSSSNASSKLMDGLNSFYSNATGSYQQLLVAN